MANEHLPVFYVLSCIALAATLYFSTMENIPNNPYFHNTMKELSEKYKSAINPAPYAFSIWGMIYLFQAAFMVYGLTTLCRKNSNGPVYKNPAVMPAMFHIAFILSLVGCVAFLFAFDREEILHSGLCVLFSTLTAHMALVINSKETLQNRTEMQKTENGDLITIYVLVQNGMDLYCSWLYVASCLSLTLVLQYSHTVGLYMDSNTAGIIGLTVFLVGSLFSNILAITRHFEAYRYMYASYFVGCWGLIAILVENYDITNPLTMIEIVGIGVVLLFLAAKIVVAVKIPEAINYTRMVNEKNMIM